MRIVQLLTVLMVASNLACMELVIHEPCDVHRVSFLIEDTQVSIPKKYASLIGFLNHDLDFLEGALPIPHLDLATWKLIEFQLPRAQSILAEEGDAGELRRMIREGFAALEGKQIIDLIRAIDFLDIPLLMEAAVAGLMPGMVTFEQLAELSESLVTHIVFNKLHAILGPFPMKHHKKWFSCQSIMCFCIVDNTTIAVAPQGHRIYLFDPHSNERVVHEGREIFSEGLWPTCKGHEGFIRDLCIASDGSIVSASDDRTVRLWDKTGKQVRELRGHEDRVGCVCATSHGKIVSGSDDHSVFIWNIQGQLLARFFDHTTGLNSVHILRDSHVVSSSYHKTFFIHDLEGEKMATAEGHTNNVGETKVLANGTIVSKAYDNTVRLWNSEAKQLAVYDYKSIGGPIRIVDDGKILVTNDEHSWCLCSTEGQGLLVPASGEEKAYPRGACFMNRNVLLIGSGSGLRVYDVSLLNRLSLMSFAQAESFWKLLEEVVSRARKARGFDEEMKRMIEEYRLLRAKHEEYWPSVVKIFEEEK